MRRALLLSALLVSTAVPAWALSSPTTAGKDDHVRQVAYDPQNRTALVLQLSPLPGLTLPPTYAPFPVWSGSTTAPARFFAMPKKAAIKLWHRAREFDRQSHEPPLLSKQGGGFSSW